jgi:carboxyl-terminal processing protease
MRHRLHFFLVVTAAAAALLLTAVRRTPQGVLSIGLETPQARAAPGQAAEVKHDLSALKIFNLTLVRVKERYVDPSRLQPRKMLYEALNSVQFNIPEVLVEPDVTGNKVAVAVNDQREVFDTSDVDSPWRLAAKLKRIFRFIESNMNAGGDLAKVEYAAVNGMLATLDPHSVLMDPEQARDMDVSTSGKFGGLGIEIRMIARKLTVIRPMRNTPASRAGIKPQDHIVKINQELTENLTSNEAVDRMRGEPDTGVTLWIERKGTAGLLRFDLLRATISVSQVTSRLLDNNVGVIRVKQFSSNITRDVAEAMKEMSAKGARAWILDLRWNPGGLLEQAVQLSDLFVDSGSLVTTVSGRDREVRRAERGFGDTTSPLAVLVNTGSASASEIVAGALKNLDRAIIIGTRTFGKGSVQELYNNEDGSKLKLTVAQYLTPGDRSIQSLGIVPDIALLRMVVPEQNLAPGDAVRLLAPTRSYGEKDLDAHLTSTYAKDTDKPAYELAFQPLRKPTPASKTAAPASKTPAGAAAKGAPAPGAPVSVEAKPPGGAPAQTTPTAPSAPEPAVVDPDEEDEEPADDDNIAIDFEIGLAKDLLGSANAATRPGLIKSARALVAKVQAEEEKRVVASLSSLGIDWSAPPANSNAGNSAAALEVKVTATPGGTVNAGDVVTVTATVKNNGAGPAWRVLARLHSDDDVIDDYEMPVGKVSAGETRTFVSKVQVPKDALDRVDRVDVEVREARGAKASPDPLTLRIKAAPRPTFAYTYQLVDDGNGDGLVQRGEKYRLLVGIKNTGEGASPEATALLRNASGDGVVLGKSRFELGALAPGAFRNLEFPVSVTRELGGDELVLEMMAYDAVLETQASEKLRFPLAQAVPLARSTGSVAVRAKQAEIHAGASADSTLVGWASKGNAFPAIGAVGPWTKVDLGGGRPGFLVSSSVAMEAGGTGAATFQPHWQSTPPLISLALSGLETSADRYALKGVITDDSHVEDVFVVVSNSSAKVDSKKVFYRSNRKGGTPKRLDFDASVPLWPGANQVTIVARETSEVRSVKTLYIYRDATRTAQMTQPTPAAK